MLSMMILFLVGVDGRERSGKMTRSATTLNIIRVRGFIAIEEQYFFGLAAHQGRATEKKQAPTSRKMRTLPHCWALRRSPLVPWNRIESAGTENASYNSIVTIKVSNVSPEKLEEVSKTSASWGGLSGWRRHRNFIIIID